MITAVVQFDLPSDVDRQKASETFERIAPLYQSMDGLIQNIFVSVTKARVQEFIFGKHGKRPKKFIMEVYGATVL